MVLRLPRLRKLEVTCVKLDFSNQGSDERFVRTVGGPWSP
jgi:hypothetical protein